MDEQYHWVEPITFDLERHPDDSLSVEKRNVQKIASSSKQAFSLVELSIVLVILGLLVGGVLSGKSLIKAAELRGVTTDFERYQAAILAFKGKYFALPGDMNNAVKFWGAQAGGTADGVDVTCAALTTGATSKATCNGDGDGMIDYDSTHNLPGDDSTHESYRAWQHLSNAGMIEGTYTGIGTSSGTTAVPGSNVPKARFPNGAWVIAYVPPDRDWSVKVGVHYIVMGAVTGSDSNFAGRWHNEILTPEQQWNIDTKMDDGKPYTGKLVDVVTNGAWGPYTANCTTTETFSTAQYNLTYTGAACDAMFQASF